MEQPQPRVPLLPPQQAPAVDPAQQSLVSALRSGFAVLRLIMIVLVVLYLSSGVFQIQPGEQGIVVRFGKLVTNKDEKSPYAGRPVFGPGWIWWALPEPFDQKIRLSGNIHKLEIDTFMFRRSPEDIRNRTDIATLRPGTNTLTPGLDGAMLTGDKNLSHGVWEVEYRLAEADQFVRAVGERPEDFTPLLQRSFENAVLREVAYRKVEEVTRTRIDVLAAAVARRLQRELDGLHVGVEVVKVNSNTIVPAQVAPAFAEVTRAENEKKQLEDAARQTATEILNQVAGPQHEELLRQIQAYGAAQVAGAAEERLEQLRREIDAALEPAEGEVAARLREAQASANTAREKIGREYEEFRYWLEQYRRYPGPTAINLWTEMRHTVLSSQDNEVFFVPESDFIDIVTNRDPQRVLEAEKARLRKQMEGR